MFFKFKMISEELELLAGKSFEEICKSPILRKTYFSSMASGVLKEEKIIDIIKRYGLFEELIIFHINEYLDANMSDELCEVILNNKHNIKKIFYFNEFALNSLLDYLRKDCNAQRLFAFYLKETPDYYAEFLENLVDAKLNYRIGFDEFKTLLKEFVIPFNVMNFSSDFLTEAWVKWQPLNSSEKSIVNMLEIAHMVCGEVYDVTPDKNYILAFKGVKQNYTSTFSDRYTYLPKHEYTCDCDADMYNDNSYGLSAWYKDDASTYCDERVLCVKINFDDIKYVNLYNGKLRASRMYVEGEV